MDLDRHDSRLEAMNQGQKGRKKTSGGFLQDTGSAAERLI